jgi:hypothetical protein
MFTINQAKERKLMITRRIKLASIITVATFTLFTLIGTHDSARGAGSAAALNASVALTSADNPELHQQIARIRAATAKYHDVSVAIEDGFVVVSNLCIEIPGEGVAGIHYANAARFVSPELILEEPEILIYIPTGDGNLRLVAVEYTNRALYRDTRSPDAPGYMPGIFVWRQFTIPPYLEEVAGPFSLLGQPSTPIFFVRWFYFLPVWVWAPNPNGLFAEYNPRLSCN